jgi:hypothetical protein
VQVDPVQGGHPVLLQPVGLVEAHCVNHGVPIDVWRWCGARRGSGARPWPASERTERPAGAGCGAPVAARPRGAAGWGTRRSQRRCLFGPPLRFGRCPGARSTGTPWTPEPTPANRGRSEKAGLSPRCPGAAGGSTGPGGHDSVRRAAEDTARRCPTAWERWSLGRAREPSRFLLNHGEKGRFTRFRCSGRVTSTTSGLPRHGGFVPSLPNNRASAYTHDGPFTPAPGSRVCAGGQGRRPLPRLSAPLGKRRETAPAPLPRQGAARARGATTPCSPTT